MSRKINFSINGVWGGRYVFEIFIEGSIVYCKAAKISYDDEAQRSFEAAERMRVEVSAEWLAELDDLEIFSWEERYNRPPKYPDDFIRWKLIFEDGEKTYCGRGINAAHKNWSRFMNWLGAIFKENDRWLNI